MLRWSRPIKRRRWAWASKHFRDLWSEDQDALRHAGLVLMWPGVAVWVKDPEDPSQAIRASCAPDTNSCAPSPDGLSFYPFQEAGIEYARDRAATLIADEMGLGKTVQAIGVANFLPPRAKILILCPASLKINWGREFEKWTTVPRTIQVISGTKDQIEGDVVILNYDLLKSYRGPLGLVSWDLLIADEAQYLKNPEAIRTRVALQIEAKKTLFLTGTPILNRPAELWPLLQVLDPSGLGSDWKRFHLRYCAARVGKHWDVSGSSNLPELQHKMRSRFMVRRTKAQVLPDLPPKIRQVVPLPPDGIDTAAELHAHRAYVQACEGVSEPFVGQVLALTEAKRRAYNALSSARQDLALAKVPKCVDFIRTKMEEDQVVVFAHHKAVVSRLLLSLPGAEAITGDTPTDCRQAIVDRFQKGEINALIGNMRAMGVGLTLTSSSTVVFVELDWVPANVSQCEDRCYRLGQTGTVRVYHLVVDGSLDARMAHTLIKKQSLYDLALDPEHLPVARRNRRDVVHVMDSNERNAADPNGIVALQAAMQGLLARGKFDPRDKFFITVIARARPEDLTQTHAKEAKEICTRHRNRRTLFGF